MADVRTKNGFYINIHADHVSVWLDGLGARFVFDLSESDMAAFANALRNQVIDNRAKRQTQLDELRRANEEANQPELDDAVPF